MINSLDDISTEEYGMVDFDQPSLDELVSFINGNTSNAVQCTAHGRTHSKDCVLSMSKKKRNRRKKNKKKNLSSSTNSKGSDSENQPFNNNSSKTSQEQILQAEVIAPETTSESVNSCSKQIKSSHEDMDILEKLRLASLNPSAIFQESQFEDDEEVQREMEHFRRTLDSAHNQRNGWGSKLQVHADFTADKVFNRSRNYSVNCK